MRVEHGNLVDFAAEKFLDAELARSPLFRRNDGASFSSKSASISRRVRARNWRALRPDDDVDRLVRIEIGRLAQQIRIQRAGQSLVGADDDHQFLLHFADLEKRMQLRIGPLLAAKQARDSSARSRAGPRARCCCALRIFDAATICIALVICAVLRIDLIRRRMSCVLATGSRS